MQVSADLGLAHAHSLNVTTYWVDSMKTSLEDWVISPGSLSTTPSCMPHPAVGKWRCERQASSSRFPDRETEVQWAQLFRWELHNKCAGKARCWPQLSRCLSTRLWAWLSPQRRGNEIKTEAWGRKRSPNFLPQPSTEEEPHIVAKTSRPVLSP